MAFGNVSIIDDGGINIINTLVDQVNQLQKEFAALLALFNTHVHQTPGASYAQNANTTVPTAGFLAPATSTGKTTLKK